MKKLAAFVLDMLLVSFVSVLVAWPFHSYLEVQGRVINVISTAFVAGVSCDLRSASQEPSCETDHLLSVDYHQDLQFVLIFVGFFFLLMGLLFYLYVQLCRRYYGQTLGRRTFRSPLP